MLHEEAFTLLEMLVVIGIIAVLIGMGAVSYSTAQKKARDAKRKQDLKAIQNCLEQYYSYNNNFKYEITSNSWPTSLDCGSSTMTPPKDPKDGQNYQITDFDTQGSKYTICATLETETPSNYCLSNQQ
jgi:prepilin-type N-terminal cleavage/methylation domain-containing protein